MSFADVYNTVVETVKNDFGIEAQYDQVFDRNFFLWDDMFSYDENNKPHPTFAVQEAAKMFFARGSWWLRWKYRREDYPDGPFLLNGVAIEAKRHGNGSRYYTLADIERMAWSLADQGSINGEKLTQIITLVLVQASMYGVFDPKRSR